MSEIKFPPMGDSSSAVTALEGLRELVRENGTYDEHKSRVIERVVKMLGCWEGNYIAGKTVTIDTVVRGLYFSGAVGLLLSTRAEDVGFGIDVWSTELDRRVSVSGLSHQTMPHAANLRRTWEGDCGILPDNILIGLSVTGSGEPLVINRQPSVARVADFVGGLILGN